MSNSEINWTSICEEIGKKNFTPIISNQVVNNTLFGGDKIIREWANDIKYPLADNNNLTRVAQFLRVLQSPEEAKSSYRDFLKRSLIEAVRSELEINPTFLNDIERELPLESTLSDLAIELLHRPDFKQETEHPLSILARLPIPIYLTTSHHHFMEAALRVIGKEPRTAIYYWWDELTDNIPPQYKIDLDFEPEVETPLVYHLHGIDDCRDSLVLTEDDYLKFLVKVTQDFGTTDAFPTPVRKALSKSLLVLLGYDLHAWDLRVLLHGLIKDNPRRPRSFALQFIPGAASNIKNTEQFREYLQKYFHSKARFEVYWDGPQKFIQTLWEKWEEG